MAIVKLAYDSITEQQCLHIYKKRVCSTCVPRHPMEYRSSLVRTKTTHRKLSIVSMALDKATCISLKSGTAYDDKGKVS